MGRKSAVRNRGKAAAVSDGSGDEDDGGQGGPSTGYAACEYESGPDSYSSPAHSSSPPHPSASPSPCHRTPHIHPPPLSALHPAHLSGLAPC
jgi:hypothetical protein